MWDIQTFDTLHSTQDFCKESALSGAEQGFVVQALKQSAGRGRHGREWIFGEGNLAVSFLLRPECSLSDVGHISILVGVALAQAIASFVKVPAVLKWPNDVMIEGRKCAGILMEAEIGENMLQHVVVGVGVNLRSAPDIGAALSDFTADDIDCSVFLNAFLDQVSRYYSHWQAKGFADIRREWLELTYEKGTALNVGAFEDIDVYGNLIVRDAQNQLKTISAGDVYLKDKNYVTGD